MRILFIVALTLAIAAPLFSQDPGKNFTTGEILVRLRSEKVSKARAGAIFNRLKGRALQKLGNSGWWRVATAPGESPKTATARFRSLPDVAEAQPNFYYHLVSTPNDPQWGTSGLYGLPKISAPEAWNLTTGSNSVVVADIDTGMRYTHEDLSANVWTNPGEINGNGFDDDGNGFADDYYGFDFFYNDPDPLDEHGHGTHTAGTIGAVGNNALGVVGVNWNVKIMVIKIFDNDGYGTTSAMLVNAYNYIRMMKLRGVNIRVTNNSYAGCDENCGIDLAIKEGIEAMGDAGILNVFAAGNSNWDNDHVPAPDYPGAYDSPSILSVAASTNTDARAGFSDWGATSVDLAAPGSGIMSTTWNTDSSYGIKSGTSMAAPHVAGAAALLSAYNPDLSAASLKATLMNSTDPLTGWDATPSRTNGRLNVFAALQNQTVCSISLSTNTIHPNTKGGLFTINVTAPPNCDYSIKKSDFWIVVLDKKVGSGTGRVEVIVRFNQRMKRTGTVTIGDQAVTIAQSRTGIF